jgi:hypothetical protein
MYEQVKMVSTDPLDTVEPTTVVITWPAAAEDATATPFPLCVMVKQADVPPLLNVQPEGNVNCILSDAIKLFVSLLTVSTKVPVAPEVVN